MLLKLYNSRRCCVRGSRSTNKPELFSFWIVVFVGVMSITIPSSFGQTGPGSSTANWQPISFGGTNFSDPFRDQQTGNTEADIIGTAVDPAFYIQHDGQNTPSSSDDLIGFRLRLAADENPAGFKGAAFVGIDANLDGAVDLFIGVNNQGSGNAIGLWNPGAGLNISPNTTSIVSPAFRAYGETALNYGFISVSGITDPAASAFDLDGGGKVDKFLSFFVPFADITLALDARGITGFSLNSSVQLIAATATQDNALNQDLSGVNGGTKSDLTWGELGAFSQITTLGGPAPAPEPSTVALSALAGGMVLFALLRRRSRI